MKKQEILQLVADKLNQTVGFVEMALKMGLPQVVEIFNQVQKTVDANV